MTSAPEIISRAEAMARGLRRFFTGKPCKHGHVVERKTSDGHCVLCTRERNARLYIHNPQKSRAQRKRYYAANREKTIARQKLYYAANREKIVARQKRYRFTAEGLAQRKRYYAENRESSKRWRIANLQKVRISKKRWNAANPEKVRKHRQRTYHNRAGALMAVRQLGLPLEHTRKDMTLAMAIVREAQRRLREVQPSQPQE
jgi:hypothetical protein